ncbi:hypothetical protein [Burkholderia contaminans]|uniref:hypothetical protein n=1 Tax=Burkholderia contaminans TaxID=488447 RepID=UPI000AA469C4|nr:hypothetical protein [Burkholderia contaminans]ELK6466151.1 hypothetical protein [Burkholderia contaminans]MCA7887747.1 hypothetical protein [Burkholderia contaminans]MCA8151391.1 hypothetical protein [Burkholderia contaminans]MEB4635207.1 hypothetical protein [Burkholderia contaminans]MEB4642502.1 hypothetical protein [Burkholderia contaminans]
MQETYPSYDRPLPRTHARAPGPAAEAASAALPIMLPPSIALPAHADDTPAAPGSIGENEPAACARTASVSTQPSYEGSREDRGNGSRQGIKSA